MKSFVYTLSLILLSVIALVSKTPPVYAAAPGTFECTIEPAGSLVICGIDENKIACSPGYKTNPNECSGLFITNCLGKKFSCIPDPQPNTVTCQLVRGRAGAACEVKAGTDKCKAGYVPDCSNRSGPDCEATTGQCIEVAGPSTPLPAYNPKCYGRFGEGVKSGLGCIPTDPQAFINTATPWAIGIGSGIAFLLGLYGSLMIVISAGDPEKMQAGKEIITSAIAGLLLIVFAVFILRIIGVDVLKLF